jgi:hypothetical protein
MEESPCIGFKPPAQTPCDVLIGVLCIRCDAFDAVSNAVDWQQPYSALKPPRGFASSRMN